MSLEPTSNLVLLFKNLILNLRPYSQEQGVKLTFHSKIKTLSTTHNSKNLLDSFTKLIKKIIAFTPESGRINISLNIITTQKQCASIKIENTGADLSRIREIPSITRYTCNVSKTTKGTAFIIAIPIEKAKVNIGFSKNGNNLGYTPYYIEINKRLNSHFKEIKSFELAANKKSENEGNFLKNVNKVIHSRMSDNYFKVNTLAKAMALSRSQLFRKIKSLTQMSPNQYLLFYRLQIAKHILETNGNDFNIGEVAYQVGFISKSHFSRAFNKQFGLSPSHYKKHTT